MAKRFFRAGLLCATALVGAAAIPAAMAQEAPGPASATQGSIAAAEGNEIVVTGSRRRTTLQDAPINISAVSADTLSKERITDVRGLGAFTPGLTIVDTGPATTGNVIIRGINSGDTSDTGANTNNSIGVYLGEVPLYLDFKLIDLERVEVLEGPQGTLYGLGTLAGAVRYIPNRPNLDKFTVDVHGRGYAESHSSSFGGSGDVTVNIPIVADHIAFRTVTGYYDEAGFIDYNHILQTPGVSNPQPARGTLLSQNGFGTPADYAANFRREADLNYERTFTTRNQLLLEVNPEFKAYLTYAHQETKTGGRQSNAAGVLGTSNYEAPFRYAEPFDRKADLFSAEIYANVFNIAQIVSATAYTRQNLTNTEDNTDLLLDLNYGYEAFPDFSSYAINHEHYQQFNQEVRLVSTHRGPVNWVLGGFYNRLTQQTDRHEYTPGFAQYFNIDRPDDLEYESSSSTGLTEKAVYGEGTLHITHKWQVTGGVRYYKYNVSTVGGQALPLIGVGVDPYPSTTILPSRFTPGHAAADGFVYKANTSYKVSDSLLAYFTYSTGYRVGGANRVVACTPQDLIRAAEGQQVLCALPNELFYGPDKTRNAELGLRGALFDKRVQFTLDGFHINWSGIQVPSQTIYGAIGIIKNAGKAVSQGVEFTTSIKVTPELVLQGNYAYTDAHLTSVAPNLIVVQDPQEQIAGEPGDRLPGSTKNSGSVQATYTYRVGNDATIAANWTATYTGDIYSRVGLRGFGTDIPGYLTHRASLTYRTKRYDVTLFADNIFDKYAVTSVGNDQSSLDRIRDANGAVAGNGVVERYYTQSVLTPRRVGIDLNFHY
jgi:outer membrane receptor protein involved in Fe transport